MKKSRIICVLALANCVSCGAPVEESEPFAEAALGEEWGVIEEAIGETSCRTTLTYDHSSVGAADVTTPTTYDRADCEKAYIVRVSNFISTSNKYFILTWGEATRPQNWLACESVRLRMDTYKWSAGEWHFDATRTGVGTWSQISQSCTVGAAGRLIPSSGDWKAVIQGIRNVATTPTVAVRFTAG